MKKLKQISFNEDNKAFYKDLEIKTKVIPVGNPKLIRFHNDKEQETAIFCFHPLIANAFSKSFTLYTGPEKFQYAAVQFYKILK